MRQGGCIAFALVVASVSWTYLRLHASIFHGSGTAIPSEHVNAPVLPADTGVGSVRSRPPEVKESRKPKQLQAKIRSTNVFEYVDLPATVAVAPSSAPFNFSACLLMKDDNVILPEWLAFHYQALPLRTVVIGLDPFSLTRPDKIASEFGKLGLEVIVWTEDDYIFDGNLWYNRKVSANATHEEQVAGYLWRQRAFLTSCMKYLKQQGHTWTALIDTDEYLSFNHFHAVGERIALGVDGVRCHAAQRIYNNLCTNKTLQEQMMNGTHIRTRMAGPGLANQTVAHFMRELIEQRHPLVATPGKPCFVIPRVLFGPEETSRETLVKDLPEGDLDPMAFHTLRFRSHKAKLDTYTGKSIFDVSHFPRGKVVQNPHKVLPRFCVGNPNPDFTTSLLRANHYTGSLETFATHRGNLSNAKQLFSHRTNWTVDAEDDNMKGWVNHFVDNVGLDVAKKLVVDLRAWAIQNDKKFFGDSLHDGP